mgnify:CR=1 FL=1|tara:strand:- start:182 stop:688 length:507 start_codon:yes stop_codon:yes gene_type:complete
MEFGWAQWVALGVTGLRLLELVYARHNLARLIARGGVEHGARHYPLFVLLHGSWLLALFFLVQDNVQPSLPLLALFAALQVARAWIIASLGPYWTTRIVTLPDAPLVRRGPYRFLRHPNYLLVAVEIPLLPLAFGAWDIALVFGLANLALLAYRIRVEEAVLAERRDL